MVTGQTFFLQTSPVPAGRLLLRTNGEGIRALSSPPIFLLSRACLSIHPHTHPFPVNHPLRPSVPLPSTVRGLLACLNVAGMTAKRYVSR